MKSRLGEDLKLMISLRCVSGSHAVHRTDHHDHHHLLLDVALPTLLGSCGVHVANDAQVQRNHFGGVGEEQHQSGLAGRVLREDVPQGECGLRLTPIANLRISSGN